MIDDRRVVLQLMTADQQGKDRGRSFDTTDVTPPQKILFEIRISDKVSDFG
jgi:hypothetical protein